MEIFLTTSGDVVIVTVTSSERISQPRFSIDLNFQDIMTSMLKNFDVSVQNLEDTWQASCGRGHSLTETVFVTKTFPF